MNWGSAEIGREEQKHEVSWTSAEKISPMNAQPRVGQVSKSFKRWLLATAPPPRARLPIKNHNPIF